MIGSVRAYMKQNIEFIVYLLGIVVFSFFYEQIKSALGGGIWFLLGAIVIIIAIRGVAIAVRRVAQRQGRS